MKTIHRTPLSVINDKELCSLVLGKNRMLYFLFYWYSCHRSDTVSNASCTTDPLVHHGRHFGRTVHALCTVNALIVNGMLRMGELAERPEDTFTQE
jgi:hypothetical protein